MSAQTTEATRFSALESRSDPRVATELAGELSGDHFAGPLPVSTRDLSLGGACVATRSPLALGSLRTLALQLPSGALRLNALGRWQQWSAATGVNLVGVAFSGASVEAQDALWDHVLDESKAIARFLLRRSELRDVGIDGAMSIGQASRLCLAGAGAAIFQQGADARGPAGSFFVLREGSVQLRVRVRDAIERDVALVEPGQIFGGLPMIAAASHFESAIARTPCKLLEIDERAFLYLSQARPWLSQKIAFAAARAYAQRLQHTLSALGGAAQAG